jgi:alkanesulfonate monooxygenase SsuD/methylene tetrahydromethanopterin reductase-like flavin-dependent oxidoreductase (luciferase family)
MPINGILEFGVALHTRELIRDGGEDENFDALFEEVELAERAGFDQAWIGDMPRLSGEDRAHAEVLTTLAAMAARTTTLKVGVAPFGCIVA